jgi:hypothetical protein
MQRGSASGPAFPELPVNFAMKTEAGPQPKLTYTLPARSTTREVGHNQVKTSSDLHFISVREWLCTLICQAGSTSRVAARPGQPAGWLRQQPTFWLHSRPWVYAGRECFDKYSQQATGLTRFQGLTQRVTAPLSGRDGVQASMVASLSIPTRLPAKYFASIGGRVFISIVLWAIDSKASTHCDAHHAFMKNGCDDRAPSSFRTSKLLELNRRGAPSFSNRRLQLRGGAEIEEHVEDLSGDGGVLKRVFRKVRFPAILCTRRRLQTPPKPPDSHRDPGMCCPPWATTSTFDSTRQSPPSTRVRSSTTTP